MSEPAVFAVRVHHPRVRALLHRLHGALQVIQVADERLVSLQKINYYYIDTKIYLAHLKDKLEQLGY